MATVTKDDVLDAIANWTVLELSEFVKAFEEKFGVSAAAPVAVAAPASAPSRPGPWLPSVPGS
jgi:large subunit ribosomal protein L7/L12